MSKRQRYFEFHDATGNSHKFYRVVFLALDQAEITWGRVGTAGQSQMKSHAEAEAKIAEKLTKGYREVGASRDPFPIKKASKPKPKPAAEKSTDFLSELAKVK